MNQGLLKPFSVAPRLSSSVNMRCDWREGHTCANMQALSLRLSLTHCALAVLGQCPSPGLGLRDLKVRLAPFVSRLWLGKHTIAQLYCVSVLTKICMCVQVCLGM